MVARTSTVDQLLDRFMFFRDAVEIPGGAKELPKNQSLVLKAFGENG